MNFKFLSQLQNSEANKSQFKIFFAVLLSASAMALFNFFSAKALSVDDFGRFNLFIVWLSIGSVIARFGSDQIIMYKFSVDGLRNLVFFLFLSFTASILLAFLIYSFILTDSDLFIISLGIFSLAAVELFFSAYKSQAKAVVYYYIRMSILTGGLLVLLSVLFFAGDYINLRDLFSWYVFLFLFIGIVLFLKLDFKKVAFTLPKEFDLKYRSYSSCNSLVGVFTNKLDLILVGFFLTPREAGIYGIVLLFLFFLNTVIGVQATYWAPIFSRFHNSSDLLMLKKSYFDSRRYSMITILLATFVCCLMIKPSVVFLGDGYTDIPKLIIIRCGFQALALILGIPGVLLSMTGNPKVQFGRLVIGIIVTGVSGAILIPYLGLIGAAISGGCGVLVSAIIGNICALKLLRCSVV